MMLETMMKKPTFKWILRKLFSRPSIVLIGSYEGGQTTPWKTGKTDFSLKVAEMLLSLGLIEEVATNINTYGQFKYIHDLETLKNWLSNSSGIKLYILDEANMHLPSRRAMSTKSVDIIQLFPEISKARARLIIVGQKISSLDSELRVFGWVSGMMVKVDLKTVYIISPYLKNQYYFSNIPRTSIRFDPYEPAPFELKAQINAQNLEPDYDKAWQWCKGSTWKTLFKHPMDCNRYLRKVVEELLVEHSHIHKLAS